MAVDTPHPRLPTIAELAEDLGPEIVQGVIGTPTTPITARDVVIDDPVSRGAFQPGHVVLAVGTPPEFAALEPLLAAAAEGGAAAIVVKAAKVDAAIYARAQELKVTLLVVSPELSWAQLHTLVGTSLTRRQATSADANGSSNALFTLANAIAARIGAPVTIEDAASRLLAYSASGTVDEPRRQTILGQRIPDFWVEQLEEAQFFEDLRAAEGALRIDHLAEQHGYHPRVVVAIRAGKEVLGSIWAAEVDRRLGPEEEAELVSAAEVAALHLVHHEAGVDLARRARSDRLGEVLEGTTRIETVARELQLEQAGPYAVLAVHPNPEVVQSGSTLNRAFSLVALFSENFRTRACQVRIADRLYVLVPGIMEHDVPALRDLAARLHQQLVGLLGNDLVIGIGRAVEHADGIPRARTEADQVVDVLRDQHPARAVASYDEVESHVLVNVLRGELGDRSILQDGPLARLERWDRERGDDLAATVETYIDAFGVLERTASRLGVHPNTVRKRLERVRVGCGINLDDPVTRFAVQAQRRLSYRKPETRR